MAGTLVRRGESSLTPVDIENYPALIEGVGALAEVMEKNAGRKLQLSDLTRITVPTGGGQSFEIFDELTRETDNVKTIEGVLVHWRRSRVYWPAPAPGQPEISHEPPSCTSVDGRFPVPGGAFGDGGESANRNLPVTVNGEQRRTCAKCPMNEWGSHPKEGRRGKACKEQILLFILPPGETLPVIVSVPPTSKAGVERFMVKLSTTHSAHYSGFQLRFGLTKVEKAGSEPYSQLVPTLVGPMEGVSRTGAPHPDTPAAAAYAYATEFANLLTVEDIIEAAAGNASSNGVVEGDVIPDGLGGDFAPHEMEEAAATP